MRRRVANLGLEGFDLRAINPLDLPGEQHAVVDEFLDRLRQASDTKIMPS